MKTYIHSKKLYNVHSSFIDNSQKWEEAHTCITRRTAEPVQWGAWDLLTVACTGSWRPQDTFSGIWQDTWQAQLLRIGYRNLMLKTEDSKTYPFLVIVFCCCLCPEALWDYWTCLVEMLYNTRLQGSHSCLLSMRSHCSLNSTMKGLSTPCNLSNNTKQFHIA